MIKIYKNSIQQKKLRQIKNYEVHSWISVVSPIENEANDIGRRFNIFKETMQDCLDGNELPRIKIENKNLIVILRVTVKKDNIYSTSPLTIILNDKNITTIALEETDIINDLKRQKIEVYTTQRSNFLINICLSIINYYQKNINSITKDVQAKKKNIQKISKKDVFHLIEIEEILNNFISSLVPNINVIKRILSHNYIDLYQKDKNLISDLLVDGEQVLDLCKTNLRTINNIREGYSTVLSMRLNQIIQILTYLTVFLTIPMIIASAYGMNIRLPFSGSENIFWILLLVNFLIMGIVLVGFIIFKKRL
ncbi:MAG: magnesium transporter CorA family protein [Patescibacteria group bacterium]|nr:magnesium transporter CorA family protein [Patescibacteria group bacterium]